MPAATSLPQSPSASDRWRIFGLDPSVVRTWIRRHRARRELAGLRDDQLRDAGL
ncbi:DUF1127 domain-containing protein, partial [Methylobacterium sp. WL93]